MSKKIMLAVDDSIHSRNALNYAVQLSSRLNKLHYVLFHIQPLISQFLQDEAQKDVHARRELERVKKQNQESAKNLVEQLKDLMVNQGIDSERIQMVTPVRKQGIAKDIMNFAQEKRYDAIVIGRRGISQLQEMVMGSVTAKLVEHSRVIPVWIVDGKVTAQNILVAVDGSDQSLRAVDHVSFMCGDAPDTRLTLYHVKSKGATYSGVTFDDRQSTALEKVIAKSNQHYIDRFHAEGVEILKAAGISDDRYEIRVAKPGRNVGKAILEKTQRGEFGTVVVGRRGVNRSFFMGSVSRHIIGNTKNRAVWVVS